MPAVSARALIQAVIDAAAEAGASATLILSPRQQPRRFAITSANGDSFVLAVYVWRGIARTRQLLDQNKSDAENIQKRLDRLAGSSLSDERRRREMYADLHRLFDRAVGAYREQLRKRVEADATRHFKALTTEPEYAGLRINDGYGLTIVHQDGSDIPIRSAGAEHVVALCLMGALQNNAPLRGPIVIDSPFGRLDRGHTRNIVRALPDMTKHVVLLVYDDELPLIWREMS